MGTDQREQIQTREGQAYWTGRFIAISDRLRQSRPGLSDIDREDAVLQELWRLCISRASQDSFRVRPHLSIFKTLGANM